MCNQPGGKCTFYKKTILSDHMFIRMLLHTVNSEHFRVMKVLYEKSMAAPQITNQ